MKREKEKKHRAVSLELRDFSEAESILKTLLSGKNQQSFYSEIVARNDPTGIVLLKFSYLVSQCLLEKPANSPIADSSLR